MEEDRSENRTAGSQDSSAVVSCDRNLSGLEDSRYVRLFEECVEESCCNEAGNCAVSAACVELDECISECGAQTGPGDTCWSGCRAGLPEDVIQTHNAYTQCASSCAF
ncbi:MAG: hypothetical protein KC561_19735, partial [Myxococcales bacterium]|nr:hypothetical protein [Myxococcales bacterium]